jgi:uncharacterized membrane protein
LTSVERNATAYAQTTHAGYSVNFLYIALFSDGTALIEQDLSLNPSMPTTSVLLNGKNIESLTVLDYKDKSVAYRFGPEPGELIINSSGIPNARLSYETPDLVNKQGRIWTFSFNSTTDFSLKLPTNSTLVELGNQFPSSVTRIGEQGLLTFHKGHIQISYVIGFLGTEFESNTRIESADIGIKDAQNRYPGIVLTGAQNLLQQALLARDNKKYSDAEKLSNSASNLTLSLIREYLSSQNAIAAGKLEARTAEETGKKSNTAEALLIQAEKQFANGNYSQVRGLVNEAIVSFGNNPSRNSNTIFPVVVSIVIAASIIVAVLVFRKNIAKKSKGVGGFKHTSSSGMLHGGSSDAPGSSTPPSANFPSAPPEEQRLSGSAQENELSGIVTRILEEKPHLRPEDQHVLKYLAENDGAVFESELRTKFQLPKTTIWRLVKRLEREELVEIRKAGGQNLIKLQYEHSVK